MTAFVLDNSVAMRWLLATPRLSGQKYAEKVLHSMHDAAALVPELWHLEVANVLLYAERNGEITAGQTEAFISQLKNLPITIDSPAQTNSVDRIIALARTYGLSSYDTAYLELAIRNSLPLATLDKPLAKAARKAGVGIYLKGTTGSAVALK